MEFMQRSLHKQALTQRSLHKQEFKLKTHLARHLATAHGLSIQPGSPRPVMKTRAAFCLITTPLTRISRKICKDILRPRHAARCCFIPINTASIKQECERGFHSWICRHNFTLCEFYTPVLLKSLKIRKTSKASSEQC